LFHIKGHKLLYVIVFVSLSLGNIVEFCSITLIWPCQDSNPTLPPQVSTLCCHQKGYHTCKPMCKYLNGMRLVWRGKATYYSCQHLTCNCSIYLQPDVHWMCSKMCLLHSEMCGCLHFKYIKFTAKSTTTIN
jgi:hypothetical protein